MLLFDDFETLDAFGPVEVLGKVEEYRLRYFSEYGGTVASAQKTVIVLSLIHISEPTRRS